MNANEIYQAAVAAGFSPQQAVTMTAIALAESSGNPTSHNDNRSTGDNSYGLWQINMIDTLGPARLKQFGIQSNDALFDPHTNAAAAFIVSGGGGNFAPWTTYTSQKYKKYLGEAQAAAGGAVQAAASASTGGAAKGAGAAGAAVNLGVQAAKTSLGAGLSGALGIVGGAPDNSHPVYATTSTQGDTLGDRLKAIMGIVEGGGPSG